LRELPRSGKAKKGGKPLSIRKRGFGQDAAPLTQTGFGAEGNAARRKKRARAKSAPFRQSVLPQNQSGRNKTLCGFVSW